MTYRSRLDRIAARLDLQGETRPARVLPWEGEAEEYETARRSGRPIVFEWPQQCATTADNATTDSAGETP